MKNLCSQHKTGFTLVEVVIALAFVGMVMTSVFALLNSALRSTYTTNSLVSRIFYIKNMFFDHEIINSLKKDPEKEIKKTIKEPSTEIVVKLSGSKNKVLEKNFKNSKIITSSAQWTDLRSEEDSIVGFLYISPAKKEEK